MKTILEKIQDLNEDIGKVPDNSVPELDPKIEAALDTIADFIKDQKTEDKREVKLIVLNIMAAFDDRFNGKWGHLGSLVFDSIKSY